MSLRVGVIGYGYWGPNLVRNFGKCASYDLTRIADIDPRRLAVAAREHPGVDGTTDATAITRADDIDVVAVATPICTHYGLVLDALRHGKHVLAEKPLAHTVAHAARLVEEAERRKLVLTVDHTFVYTPAIRWMRDWVASGAMGDLFYLDAVRTNLGLFQHDVGVLWDLAPHDISILQYVLNRPVEAVSATGSCHAGSRVPNIAYLSLDLGGGAMAHVHVNWLSPVKIRRVMLAGSQRMALFDDMETSEKIKVYDSGVSLEHLDLEGQQRLRVEYRSGDMTSPALTSREALATEVEHLARCITMGETPLTGAEAGLETVRILEAAQRSLERGGERVKL